MRVLVTGANGQLGHDVVNELIKRGHKVIATDVVDSLEMAVDRYKRHYEFYPMNIVSSVVVEDTISKTRPEAIIHCAAWTAVDAAEEEENKQKVYNINVVGTRNIAEAAKKYDCKVLYLSTDYVFNGKGE
ncbi:MAG: SDR family NAD(P)-dependent oxidoreductase, partial [Erysipelotrichaceae bacterium]|nr:SDR family NAD(P)-dependent oxidoreductase [Erysipelotrichaceae bacterium]